MYSFTLISVFAFGSVIGSFLNVVILRRGTGIGFLKSSFCFTCRVALRFYELVPIFSFLALRGRCRSCRAKIHFQYPLVETLAGILFLGVWLREMGGTTLLDIVLRTDSYALLFPRLALLWTIASVLLIIAVYDIRHKIIPNGFVYTFIALSFVSVVAATFPKTYHLSPITFFNYLTAGLAFFLVFAAVWLMSRGKWIGFGDAKFAAGIGLLLGLSSGAAALILSFWIGALISIVLLAAKRLARAASEQRFKNQRQSSVSKISVISAFLKYQRHISVSQRLFSALKNLTIKSEIPFAPFLVAGTFLAYFFNIGFFDIAGIFVIG